jgi:hypothetical protein
VSRRRFDFLVTELSVAVGRVVPRYALWMLLHEQGWDPVQLGRDQLLCFHDGHLPGFLADQGLALSEREGRRLRRRLVRFDPRHPTPEETMARLFSQPG